MCEWLSVSLIGSRRLTPGTNINEALLKAIQMLVRASNQGVIDPRSVSMIILVSDGDPTVGELDTAHHFLASFTFCTGQLVYWHIVGTSHDTLTSKVGFVFGHLLLLSNPFHVL